VKVSIPISDREVFAALKYDERARIAMWETILIRFEQAPNKALAVASLTAEYGVDMRLSQGTLYRRLAAWKQAGWRGLARKAALAKVDSPALPPGFVLWWGTIVMGSQRKLSPAYRSLFFDHLCTGRVIPGYDTDWRGIWAAEHPGWAIPERCPYRPHEMTPAGWSERNLRRVGPQVYASTAARIGTAAASAFLPSVPTTRVGLRLGSLWIMDDVFHDVKVRFLGNREAQIVVELGAIEALTGHYATFGFKPVREREDGSREHLRETFVRYLLGDILCRKGFCPDGCLIVGEHGTAHMPKGLLDIVNRWAGEGKVRFLAGGIQNQPIAKGLFEGRARGNFRIKALLESHHNLKKNDLALLPGQKGADPVHAPEDLESKIRLDKALTKAAMAVFDARPDLVERLQSPFLNYWQYVEAVRLIYDRIGERTRHEMEGFEELGFTVEQWRIGQGDVWKPMAMLAAMHPSEREPLTAMIRANPSRYLLRPMSPREAWEHAGKSHELIRLPDCALPEILGPSLGTLATVNERDTFEIPDPYIPGKTYPVAALVTGLDGRQVLLPRRERFLVHLNPFDGAAAYVSRPGGEFIGRAPVMHAVCKTDSEAMHRNLGILKSVQAAELKRLAPLGEQRMEKLIEATAENVRLLTGRDPLIEAEQSDDDAAVLTRAATRRPSGAAVVTDADCEAVLAGERLAPASVGMSGDAGASLDELM
jgi:hypothetical protein